MASRRQFTIKLEDLKRMGVILKRAKYFILCNGSYFTRAEYFKKNFIEANIILEDKEKTHINKEQLRLF